MQTIRSCRNRSSLCQRYTTQEACGYESSLLFILPHAAVQASQAGCRGRHCRPLPQWRSHREDSCLGSYQIALDLKISISSHAQSPTALPARYYSLQKFHAQGSQQMICKATFLLYTFSSQGHKSYASIIKDICSRERSLASRPSGAGDYVLLTFSPLHVPTLPKICLQLSRLRHGPETSQLKRKGAQVKLPQISTSPSSREIHH